MNILKFNIEYPICYYSESSRRNNKAEMTLMDKLKLLSGWSEFSEIAIDGQNGTTKSTLCGKLNRKTIKINTCYPEITQGSDYNYDPKRAFEYMFLQASAKSPDSVWDRCMFSNLIFYFVHHLMGVFKNDPIPSDVSIVWPIFNTLASNVNLSNIIHYCKSIKNIPTMFFVCSDLEYISKSLYIRAIATNGLNDLWNSKEFNYQMAQYHSYVWCGHLFGYPVFDLVDFFKLGYNIYDMHTIIASKIDRQPKYSDSDVKLPDIDSSKTLFKLLESMRDDVLMYDYSKK